MTRSADARRPSPPGSGPRTCSSSTRRSPSARSSPRRARRRLTDCADRRAHPPFSFPVCRGRGSPVPLSLPEPAHVRAVDRGVAGGAATRADVAGPSPGLYAVCVRTPFGLCSSPLVCRLGPLVVPLWPADRISDEDPVSNAWRRQRTDMEPGPHPLAPRWAQTRDTTAGRRACRLDPSAGCPVRGDMPFSSFPLIPFCSLNGLKDIECFGTRSIWLRPNEKPVPRTTDWGCSNDRLGAKDDRLRAFGRQIGGVRTTD